MQQLSFDTPNGQLAVNLPEATSLTPAERVWQGLLIQRLQDLTARSGLILCGVYPQTTFYNYPSAHRRSSGSIICTGVGSDIPETVTVHVRSCITLTRLLANEFPALFAPDPLAMRDEMIAVLEFHDGDEPFSGDEPDDGSQDKNSKNRRELQTFVQNISYLSDENLKARLVQAFVHFQYPDPPHALYPGWTAHDRDVAQLTRLIDKADAVFSALLAERSGHAGHLSYKEEHYNGITADDAHYIQLCGTDCISDTWAAHFLHDFHHYYGFRQIASVLHAAVLEVRGTWYPWWGDLCKAFGIHFHISD